MILQGVRIGLNKADIEKTKQDFENLLDKLQNTADSNRIKINIEAEKDLLKGLSDNIRHAKEKIKTITQTKDSLFINTKVENQAFRDITARLREVKSKVDEFAKVKVSFNVDEKGKERLDSANLTYYNKELGKTVNETMRWVETQKKVNGEMVKLRTFRTVKMVNTDDMSQARKEAEKLTEAMAKVNEQSQQRRKDADRQVEINQAKAINKEIEESYRKQQELTEAIAKAREQHELRKRAADRQLEINQAKAINKELEDNYKNQLRLNQTLQEFKNEMLGVNGLKGRMDLFAEKERGKYNVGTFDDLYKRINDLNVNTPDLENNIKQIRLEFGLLERAALPASNILTRTFENAYKFLRYYLVGGVLVGFIRGIRESVKYITELNSAITEIGMVTNQNRQQTAGLAEEYNKLAKQMKVLTTDITAGAVEFYRQGLKQEEVMERLRQTTMYSKIANLDFKQSAELLTAAVNSMGITIERASDVFLLLGDATATSGAEIAKGFSKVGGTANALNIEFEKVASYIAVISAKTRESAESIGTSLNTMFSRMSRITESGFSEEDETRLNDVAKALNEIGIKLVDQEGNFRNFGIILDEVAGKWDGLDSKMKAYIANTIGGVRQQSKFYNLMEGYSESMRLYEQSLDAAGTTQSKYNIYLESNQAIIDRLKSSVENLRISLLNSEFLMFFVKLNTGIVDSISALKGWNYAIIAATISLLALASASKKMNQVNLVTTFTTLTTSLIPTIKAMFGLKSSIDLATISATQFNVAMGGVLIIIGAIVTAFGAFINYQEKQKKALDESVKSFREYESSYEVIDKLIDKYGELSKVMNRSKEQEKELLSIKQKLNQLLPKSSTLLENETMELSKKLEILKELNKEELENLKSDARKNLEKYEGNYDKAKENLIKYEDELKKWNKVYEDLFLRRKDLNEDEINMMGLASSMIDDLNKKIVDEKNKVEAVDNARAILNATIEDENKALDDNLEKVIQVGNSYYNLSMMQESIVKELIKTRDNLKDVNSAIDEYNKNGKLSSDTILKLLENHSELLDYLDDEKELYKKLIEIQDEKIKSVQNSLNIELKAYTAHLNSIFNLYDKDIDNFETAEKAKRFIASQTRAHIESLYVGYINSTGMAQYNMMKAWESAFIKQTGIELDIDKYFKLKSINISDLLTSDKSKSGSSLTEYEAQFDLTDKYQRKLADINDELVEQDRLIKIVTENLKLRKDEGELSQALEFENQLLDEQRKKIELLKKSSLGYDEILSSIEEDFKNIGLDVKGKTQAQIQKEYENMMISRYGKYDTDMAKEGFQFGTSKQAQQLKKEFEDREKEYNKLLKSYVKTVEEKEKAAYDEIQLEIEHRATKKEVIELEFRIKDEFYSDAKNKISELDYQLKLLGENDADRKFELLNEKIAITKSIISDSEERINTLNNSFKSGAISVELYKDKFVELTNRVREGNLDLQDYQNTILDTIRKTIETEKLVEEERLYKQEEASKKRLKDLEDNLYMVSEKDFEKLQSKKIKALKDEIRLTESRLKSKKDDVVLQSLLIALQDELTFEQDKTYDGLTDFKEVYEEIANAKIKALQDELDALEEKSNLEKEIEEREKRQLEIQELQLKLQNLSSQKTVQQLKQGKDGKWQFEYVVDQKQVEDVQTQLKNKQEELDKWEQDNTLKHQKEQLQAQIKHEQDILKAKQDSYNKQQQAEDKVLNDERNRINAHYRIIDALVADRLEELRKTNNNSWDGILKDIAKSLAKAEESYNKLLGIQKSAQQILDDMDYDFDYDSGGSSSGSSSNKGGSSGSSSDKDDTNWSKIYMDARKIAVDESRSRSERIAAVEEMEYANRQANNGKLTADVDINTIRKKLGLAVVRDLGGILKAGMMAVNLSGKDEQILSPEQTKAWRKLVDNLPRLDSLINLDKTPKFAMAGAGDIQQTFIINGVEVHGVQDALGFINSIINLPQVTIQKVKSS